MKQTHDVYYEVSLYRIGGTNKVVACSSDDPKWMKIDHEYYNDLLINIDPDDDEKVGHAMIMEMHGTFLYATIDEMRKMYGDCLVFASNMVNIRGNEEIHLVYCDSKDDAEMFIKKHQESTSKKKR